MSTLYMQGDKSTIAKNVIFSGDPWRVDMLAKNLDDVRHIAFSREFNTYTGNYKGVPITITSTGIGAPSAAIAMEEMYDCGMEVAVRMGTTMGLYDGLLGKFLIPTACMRDEKTSLTYAPLGYPAVADFDLVACMNKSVQKNNGGYVNALNATMDGFYSQMKPSRLSLRMGNDMSKTFDNLRKQNISCIDMESSCMLTLANLMGIRACVVTLVTVLEGVKDGIFGDDRKKAEAVLCKIVLDGLASFVTKN